MPQHEWEMAVRLETSRDMLPICFLRRDYPDEPVRGVPMRSSRDNLARPRGRETLELDGRAARAGLYGVEPAARYVFMIRQCSTVWVIPRYLDPVDGCF